jgi:hypothetical protein
MITGGAHAAHGFGPYHVRRSLLNGYRGSDLVDHHFSQSRMIAPRGFIMWLAQSALANRHGCALLSMLAFRFLQPSAGARAAPVYISAPGPPNVGDDAKRCQRRAAPSRRRPRPRAPASRRGQATGARPQRPYSAPELQGYRARPRQRTDGHAPRSAGPPGEAPTKRALSAVAQIVAQTLKSRRKSGPNRGINPSYYRVILHLSRKLFSFCNSIGTFRTWRDVRLRSAMWSRADLAKVPVYCERSPDERRLIPPLLGLDCCAVAWSAGPGGSDWLPN